MTDFVSTPEARLSFRRAAGSEAARGSFLVLMIPWAHVRTSGRYSLGTLGHA